MLLLCSLPSVCAFSSSNSWEDEPTPTLPATLRSPNLGRAWKLSNTLFFGNCTLLSSVHHFLVKGPYVTVSLDAFWICSWCWKLDIWILQCGITENQIISLPQCLLFFMSERYSHSLILRHFSTIVWELAFLTVCVHLSWCPFACAWQPFPWESGARIKPK